MRILHTSDWHLGARLCDRDRSDEQKAFLDWLLLTLKEEKIDVLIVSGDIFDTSNPPNSAETLYYNFLCSLKDSGVIKTIIIGGNHDSISKLNSPRSILEGLSIHVVGGAENNFKNSIIPVENGNSELLGIICAVPFLRERDIRVPVSGESWEEREQSIVQGISDYYKAISDAASSGFDLTNIPLVATGHLFVAGSLSGEGQRDLYVGNLGALTPNIFPDSFQYVALGHIHKAQTVGGTRHIRYSGSPLPMEFGEKNSKSVIITEFKNKEIVDILEFKIPLFRMLHRFKGTFEEVCSQMENLEIPTTPFWSDTEIEGGAAVGDVNLLLNQKAEELGIELLRIRVLHKEGENIFTTDHSAEIKDLDAEDVFKEKCASAGLSDEELEELFPLYRELLKKVTDMENTTVEN